MANSIDTIIASRRTALPSHELAGVRFRRWAATVCDAEVRHARSEVGRIAVSIGATALHCERRDTDWIDGHFLPHETAAATALNWLSHVQTHESDARGPWARLSCSGEEYRAHWLKRYRYLMRGFLKAVRSYQTARAAFDAHLAMEAA